MSQKKQEVQGRMWSSERSAACQMKAEEQGAMRKPSVDRQKNAAETDVPLMRH